MRNVSKTTVSWMIAALAAAAIGTRATNARCASYSREVQPILARHCYSCHGPDVAEGGLALHVQGPALFGTDATPGVIVSGEPDHSELILRVKSDDEWERMPLDAEPLSEEEITILREWISEGAPFEKHWAFIPREAIEPPEVVDASWIRNPIDRFILAKLEEEGLKQAPLADPAALFRRVYYDVIGLPPTPEETIAFLSDPSPEAYEKLVDRLLESPHYGEKWARHWLDVVRYAESNSFERDAPKPYAWRYRDYVIRSLNEDKPYDQFVREQLAGDELDQITRDSIIATGYYRLGTWDDEPADPLQSRYDDLDNIVSTTGQAFLGLTVGCARCHDHKIDPFPQADYYGLLAFFADVTPYALPKDHSAHVHSLWNLSPDESQSQRAELQEAASRLERERRELEQIAITRMDGPDQRLTETDGRQRVLDEKLEDHQTDEERTDYVRILSELKDLRTRLDELPEDWALSLAKCYPHPDPTHVMLRGNAHALGDAVEPHYPELFGDATPPIPMASEEARSAGRRVVLAEWIASPDNMLASRVIANRVWQHHFGRGIVRSANNFGLLGTAPTHPKLLDWLANYLTEHDWRLKELHRLILNSSAYRMSSQSNEECLAADPENDYFWRFNSRRLSAEEIRDSVLSASGQLNDKLYGPSVYPKLSEEVLATQSKPGHNWNISPSDVAARRSIYIHVKRSVIPPELAVFDFPDTDSSCEARFNTTQASQALNLLHSEFVRTQSRHLAERARSEAGDQLRDQVSRVFWICLQREPDKASVEEGLGFIERLVSDYHLEESEAMREFCLMTLNLNEFVYLD